VNPLPHLTEQENAALDKYIAALSHRYDGPIRAAILFGSKARGDAIPISDVDLMIITADDDWQLHKQLRRIAARISLEYDVLLAPLIMSERDYRELVTQRFTLYQNIECDGIVLYRS
jgi:predicted nucleotidyltransferase